MDPQLRQTGIGVVGDVAWGTHFFLFYETKEDLIDALVPYFKAGLEGGEFCLWVITDPLTESEVTSALRRSVPDFERHQRRRSIEIVQGREWYMTGEDLDLERVARAWNDKADSALSRGYAGLRLSAGTAWIEKKAWKEFSKYEAEVNEIDYRQTDDRIVHLSAPRQRGRRDSGCRTNTPVCSRQAKQAMGDRRNCRAEASQNRDPETQR